MKFPIGALAIFLFSGQFLPSSAQVRVPVEPNCLRKVADQIPLKSKITVVIQDGSEMEGRLVSFDLAQSHLTFQPSEQTLALYRIARVDKIQYRKIGPESFGKGVLYGAMVGGFLCLPILLANDDNSWDFSGAVGASFIVAGAAIGLVAGCTRPTVHTIECK